MAGRRRKSHHFAYCGLAVSRGRTLYVRGRIGACSTDLGAQANSHAPVAFPIFPDKSVAQLPRLKIRRKTRRAQLALCTHRTEPEGRGHFGTRRHWIIILIADECRGWGHTPKVHRKNGAIGNAGGITCGKTRGGLRVATGHHNGAAGAQWINLMTRPELIATSTSRHLRVDTCTLRGV